MRILFDMVHPADVLFFKRPIDALLSRGDEVSVVSRKKDITCQLLDEFGLPHTPASTARSGLFGQLTELLVRDVRVLAAVRSFKPNVMAGFGGVAISHCTALTGIPSISFYDTEIAHLQNRITWPFISRLYVPRCYSGATPKDRTERIPGIKELSYLHPNGFTPSREIAVSAGLDPNRENYLLRIVAWRANHDIGKSGWSIDELNSVVRQLEKRGKVHVSSEVPLDSSLEHCRFNGSATQIHHLMAFCDLYIGESATMACEAAVLGIPSVFAGQDHRGYIDELESAHLISSFLANPNKSTDQLISEALYRDGDSHRSAYDAYFTECPDWAIVIVDAIDNYA